MATVKNKFLARFFYLKFNQNNSRAFATITKIFPLILHFGQIISTLLATLENKLTVLEQPNQKLSDSAYQEYFTALSKFCSDSFTPGIPNRGKIEKIESDREKCLNEYSKILKSLETGKTESKATKEIEITKEITNQLNQFQNTLFTLSLFPAFYREAKIKTSGIAAISKITQPEALDNPGSRLY